MPEQPAAAAAASCLDLAQALAAELLVLVDEGHSLDGALLARADRLEALGPHLRAVCRDVCFGVLRHRGRLRAMLRPLLQKSAPQPLMLALLSVAAYQLLHTRTAAHAVVDHAVRAAVTMTHPAVGGFVNAVLRNLQRRRAELETGADATPEGRHSHPEWWIRRLRRDHPRHWKAILAAAQGHPPLTLRVNRRRCTVADYLERLQQAGLQGRALEGDAIVVEPPCAVERLPGFAEGLVSVQDASAQLAATLLAARDGERVLDACAAPGGKTAHLLELADLDLTALDHDPRRLGRVTDNLRRLGLQAELRCANAADLAAWWDGRPFDRILLDAPCTGSGITRRHPDIRWLRQPGDPARLGQTQLQLAAALWKTLKPGGTLLFATCSLFSEEGPSVVQAFLAAHPDARLRLPEGPSFQEGWVLPDALHDGFFYALFERH
ncbi:MAG: 16S rRNA (cytosine(967)-C(5))-methyltransferase RsmB [Pseudomonadota bacterium]|nr:16S rRNA (cytosine(967)-C(5))-methyltransferase RsmB [Pseudomonadota bacterium]